MCSFFVCHRFSLGDPSEHSGVLRFRQLRGTETQSDEALDLQVKLGTTWRWLAPMWAIFFDASSCKAWRLQALHSLCQNKTKNWRHFGPTVDSGRMTRTFLKTFLARRMPRWTSLSTDGFGGRPSFTCSGAWPTPLGNQDFEKQLRSSSPTKNHQQGYSGILIIIDFGFFFFASTGCFCLQCTGWFCLQRRGLWHSLRAYHRGGSELNLTWTTTGW